MEKNRRTKFNEETMPEMARVWRREGATLGQIAERFGVDNSTLWRWTERYPVLREALLEGIKEATLRVENSLLKRAEGYFYDEETKAMEDGQPVVKKIVTRYEKPDVNAQKFWLINRARERWTATPPEVEEDYGVRA